MKRFMTNTAIFLMVVAYALAPVVNGPAAGAPSEGQRKKAQKLLENFQKAPWPERRKAGQNLVDFAKSTPGAVVPRLVELAKKADKKNDHTLQKRVLFRLRQIADPAGLPAIRAALRDGVFEVRHTAALAARALGEAGKPAVPELKSLLNADHPQLRIVAVRALAGVAGGTGRAKLLGPALESEQASVRIAAIQALADGEADTAPVRDQLLALLENGQLYRRGEKLPGLRPAGIKLLPRLMPEASEHADELYRRARRAGPELQKLAHRTLVKIRNDNVTPGTGDREKSVLEGRSVEVSAPVDDPDALQAMVRAELVEKPEHGKLKRLGALRFRYDAAYGFSGSDQFAWRVTDGQDRSDRGTARITVNADETPPTVLMALAPLNRPDQVHVVFDEPVRSESAGRPDHYRIRPERPIESAKPAHEGHGARLKTGTLKEGNTYTLRAEGVADRAAAANRLAATERPLRSDRERLGFERVPHGSAFGEYGLWKRRREVCRNRIEGEQFADADRGGVLKQWTDGRGKDNWQQSLVRDFKEPLKGRWRLSFTYWETRNNRRGHLWFSDAGDNRILQVGSAVGPGWKMDVQGFRRGNPVFEDTEAGDDYKHWINVQLEVDLPGDRVRVTFHDTDEGLKKTYGWYDLPSPVEGIGRVGVGPKDEWFVDDVTIRPVNR